MKKTNSRQFHKMVQLMEQNPSIATGVGRFGSTKLSHKDAWQSFAVELNFLGPPLRDGKEWHKVWLHFRLKTKKKIATIRKEATETGGGPNRQLSLSPLEQAVDVLLSLTQAAAPSGRSFGDNAIEAAMSLSPETATLPTNADEGEVEDEEVAVDENIPPVRKSKRQLALERDEERLCILKNQTKAQSELLKKAKNIEKDLHDIAKCTRKILDLKAEKVATLKAKEKRKEREMFEANRRHKENLELQTQILEVKKLKYGLMN